MVKLSCEENLVVFVKLTLILSLHGPTKEGLGRHDPLYITIKW